MTTDGATRTRDQSDRRTTGLLAPFADELLAFDLPRLPVGRRERAVTFIEERIATMPSPMRVGVLIVAALVRSAMLVVGRRRVATALAPTGLPLLGEYVRLHRSLGYAFIWETWPDTRADGGSP